MATHGPEYPILVDTDALIAVANSPLWELIPEQIGLTTTNVYQQEPKRHRDETGQTHRKGVGRTDSIMGVPVFWRRSKMPRRR